MDKKSPLPNKEKKNNFARRLFGGQIKKWHSYPYI
jgi:hypothetical protein